MTDIRLYMLQSGSLKCKVHNIKMNQGVGDDYEIPVPFYFIAQPDGHTIIDGGNAIEVATDPRGYWGGICDVYWPVLDKDKGCVDQIKALDYDPADVRYVVQSHLHLDHTGAIGRFPNARHIVQRSEYEYAFTPDWFAAGGYIRADFDRPGLNWQFLSRYVDDYYDIYADGTLTTVFSPGHSPGHQSFLVRLKNSPPMLLAIDAAYTLDHWNEQALPGFLASTVDTVRSVRKLRTVAERAGATVVTGHDPDAWPAFKQGPHYYD
ncbi:N-acyl homoserine lactonase AttM [Sphingomonas sp. NCPPB 2930]|uniref:AttM family quorum-quenching N-acyl homoserine lactonase n=1 Tax=Sphingomonas sp. NCPPB 2930 TaxID=3162788 RepID=UPI0036D94783